MVTKISKNNRNALHSRIIWVVKNIRKVSFIKVSVRSSKLGFVENAGGTPYK